VILDTSAIVAILTGEGDAERLERMVVRERCRMSSVTHLETSIVLTMRHGPQALVRFDLWLEAGDIEVLPFTPEHARIARAAYDTFGKGRHPAGLNFGDCASYALAISLGEPLLFKGNDFAQTDVERAQWRLDVDDSSARGVNAPLSPGT
jgi:ribonuclease VapC